MSKHITWTGVVLLLILLVGPVASEPKEQADKAAGGARVTVQTRSKPNYPKLTEQQEKETLAFLREHFPDYYRKVIKLKKENPQSYYRMLRSRWWFLRSLKQKPERVREAYIEQYKSTTHIWRIVRKYRNAKGAEAKKKLEASLQEEVTKLFDAEQIIREYRLAQLEERLKQLREEHRRRARDRDKIIPERVEQYKKTAAARQQSSSPRRRKPTTKPAKAPDTQPVTDETETPKASRTSEKHPATQPSQ